MPYEYLEDIATADIAFRAWGKNLDELFQAAANATMNVMIEELDKIEPQEQQVFNLENDDLDMLLFNFLQEFIYYKDSQQLLLRPQQVQIDEKNDQHKLSALTQGEKLDPSRHQQRVDVKAVTLHRFQLEKTSEGWTAMVILDI